VDEPGAASSLVVFGGRTDVSYLLINRLAERFGSFPVVFERPHLWRLLRYRRRRLGMATVAGQLLFQVWDRLIIRPRSRAVIRTLLAPYDLRPPDGRLPTVDVDSVNDAEVVALLEREQPQVVVVTGTGIIRRPVLGLAPMFLNIHCGITPWYRGVHGAFWAISDGRPERAGTTIHVVDAGVDTGPVVARRTIDIDPRSDTFRTLVIKQYLAGIDPMLDAVSAALEGVLPREAETTDEGAQWFSPTLVDHVRFVRRLRAMRD
jgi:hypothetical protein